MRIGIATAAFGVLSSFFGRADREQPGAFTVYGPGTVSCGTWTTDAENGKATGSDTLFRSSRSWVQGFVSGAGWGGVGPLRTIPDAAAMTRWVDFYCKEHPLDTLAKASQELVLELERK